MIALTSGVAERSVFSSFKLVRRPIRGAEFGNALQAASSEGHKVIVKMLLEMGDVVVLALRRG